jgi:hypothetical protein
MDLDFFERWVNVDWPHGIPTDCETLADEQDCLERNLLSICPSCAEYARRLDEYYSVVG